MNRHVDFCNDSECPTCEPEGFQRMVERKRSAAIVATKDLTDEQLEYALTLRKANSLKSRREYLKQQRDKKLEEAQELQYEIGKIIDQLEAIGIDPND